MGEEKVKKITLSVIMPVYNAEKYLDFSVQSVLNQTYKEFELIIVNDGSKDHSLEICRKYEALDSRVRIIDQENKGISEARNAGIDQAIGKYITFIDNDDMINPSMYEIMLKYMTEEKLDLVMCNAVRRGEYKIEEVAENCDSCELTKRNLYEKMFSNSEIDWEYMAVWNKIYRSRIVKNIRFKETGTEDTVFNCQYYRYIKKARLIKQDLYYWIQRRDSVSHSEFGIRDYLILKDYYWMNQYIQKYEKEYMQYSLIKLYKLIFNSRYRGRKSAYEKEVKNLIKEKQKVITKSFYGNCEINNKIKVLFTIFYYLPITYSTFRWINERVR